MNSGEDTKPVPVYRPGTTRPDPRRREQGSRTNAKQTRSRSNAPRFDREAELKYFARELAREQEHEKKRAEQKKQLQGCFVIIIILAIIAVVVNNNIQTSPGQNVVQAILTPCERTMNEIDGATGRYGRMEIPNSTSLRMDGLCDVTFHYWTDKPTESERYNERNQLLRTIGRVIQDEDLPVGRLDLRTYAPNRSGSYVMWVHEIFQKSELPYN